MGRFADEAEQISPHPDTSLREKDLSPLSPQWLMRASGIDHEHVHLSLHLLTPFTL